MAGQDKKVTVENLFYSSSWGGKVCVQEDKKRGIPLPGIML